MKKKVVCILTIIVCMLSFGCGNSDVDTASTNMEESTSSENIEHIVVGFSQLGAESDWRNANSNSMRTTFCEENGYTLIFDDAQQKQENQITSIRNFIQQEVDYIVLAPVKETGWDTVLQEAKDAGIPVIIVDRMIQVEDASLYTAWVGSDFALEGREATEWIHRFLEKKNIANANIVNIQGTIGATPQIGRTNSLRTACMLYENMTLLDEVPGDFTQAKAKEVMDSLLKKYDDINIVYCENDNEAFGAIEAIEGAGKRVGSNIAQGEIMIVSFDAASAGMQMVMDGKISLDVECNPLHGPRVQSIIKTMERGGKPDKIAYAEEKIFAHDDTVKSVTVDDETYEIIVVTQEILDQRAY